MKLPELKEGMAIKCLTSPYYCWDEGKEYPVKRLDGEFYLSNNDGDLYTKGDSVGMQYEVIEPKPEWNGKGYPPVGVDCMISFENTDPSKAKINYIGTNYCCYTFYRFNKPCTLQERERSTRLNKAKFTPIKTNRQEAIDSIVGDDFTSKALATDLVDEIIAGKHKWLEFTGGE